MAEYREHRYITPGNRSLYAIATDGYVDVTPEAIYDALKMYYAPDIHFEGDVTLRVSVEAFTDYLAQLGIKEG